VKWALVALAAMTSTAVADKADVLFKQGKKLLGEKKYAEACAAFEKSDKLDHGIGAVLNIALCYEEWGKLATAYRRYREAEKMAVDTKDQRQAKIHERVAALDSLVPRLTVKVPVGGDTTGLAVTVDGVALSTSQLGEPQLVDPGPRVIEYTVNGSKKSKTVPIERNGSSEIMLDVPKKGSKTVEVKVDTKPVDKKPDDKKPDDQKPPETVGVVAPPSDPGRTRKLIGLGVGSAGLIAVGVSSYMTLSARSKYNDAITQHCGGSKTMCDDTGLTITRDARSEANKATIVFAVGAAAVAGGVVLYLTAPKASTEHAMRVVPVIDRDGAQVVLGGSF
jgi:hypothetical protein